MHISWLTAVTAFQPNVDEHTKHLLSRYDAFLSHRSVPESTHQEVLKSKRRRGNQGCYDLVTLQPGFSDVETYCMKHAETGQERQFFKNKVVKKISECMKRMSSSVNNRGGDDDDAG